MLGAMVSVGPGESRQADVTKLLKVPGVIDGSVVDRSRMITSLTETKGLEAMALT